MCVKRLGANPLTATPRLPQNNRWNLICRRPKKNSRAACGGDDSNGTSFIKDKRK
jgi:hypothetical protein